MSTAAGVSIGSTAVEPKDISGILECCPKKLGGASSMDTKTYDATNWRRARIANVRGRFAWPANAFDTAERRDVWQADFRAAFLEALGGLQHWARPPLDATVIQVEQMDGYRRESISFTTRDNLRAFGYLLVPDHTSGPRPTMLAAPGHGRGIASCVGIGPNGEQRRLHQPDEYANDFALQCVANGYTTLALEAISFGVRRDAVAQTLQPEASSCTRDAMAALMLGETLAGWRVWDAMRALDYLSTRNDCVDPNRIGVIGISGGGLLSLFLAAADTRIKAAVVSGYFNTFMGSILAVDHCVDNFVPGLLNLCEMPDLSALIAPRLLFTESGTDDPIFPLATYRLAVDRAQSIYSSFDAATHYQWEVFNGGHEFHGKGAFDFLDKNFATR